VKAGKLDEARRAFRIAQEQYPGDVHAVLSEATTTAAGQ
jgi:hypothetical protein